MSLFLHIDMNNFYASVECAERPDLDGLPVAVAGDPKKRHGIVLAKNQVAKALGVSTGDTVGEAKSKAPNIVFLPPHFDRYDRISKRMFGICNRYSCFVEPFGPDECWLDCTQTVHLFGSGKFIADSLRENVRTELGITASVGVSFSKMFAKLGSDMKKPDATTVISEDNFREKVWPLPAEDLCGIGRRTSEKLHRMNVFTIGDLANTDERVLVRAFGKNGADLRRSVNGRDGYGVREAVEGRDVKSIGHGLTALRDLETQEDINTLVYYLSELVAARMVKHGVNAKGVAVHVRTNALTHAGKQTTLSYPIRSSADIAEVAIGLIGQVRGTLPLRSIDVSVFMLSPAAAPRQLSFFDGAECERNERLDDAVAAIRLKYGKGALIRACHAAQDIFCDKNVGDFLPFKR